jgi:hypothetical protein
MLEDRFSLVGLAKHFTKLEKKGFNLLFPFEHQDDRDTDMEDSKTSGNSHLSDQELTPRPHFNINTVQLKESSDPLTIEDHIDIETMRNRKGKYDPFVDAGSGKMVSKAQVLREIDCSMFSRLAGLTDRLMQVAGATRFIQVNSNTIQSGSVFRTSLFCVGDPVATLVVCESCIFLAIVHVNNIVFDSNTCVEIDTSLLIETIVIVQYQICQLTEVQCPNDKMNSEWRWNRLLE